MPTTWTAVNSKPNFNDGNTKLWSPFEGADGAVAYSDLIAGAYTFLGTAQLDTAQKANGSASLLLGGDSDYLTLPTSDSWNLAGGDFTLECRVRFNAVPVAVSAMILTRSYGDTTMGWSFFYNTDVKQFSFDYSKTGAAVIATSATYTAVINTWYHIAVTRSSANVRFFVNGTQIGTTINIGTDVIYNNSKPLSIGIDLNDVDSPGTDYLNGWLDEVRISKGVARWTSNFTPSTMWVDV